MYDTPANYTHFSLEGQVLLLLLLLLLLFLLLLLRVVSFAIFVYRAIHPKTHTSA